MEQNGRKVIIIGGGIAGLCAAVYAQKCGYQAQILEMHDMAGGLATSWRRGQYTFETCLHWLLGSKPGGELHSQWQEVFDIHSLKFVDPGLFVRLESDNGRSLNIYSDVDRLEAEMLKVAPSDAAEIRNFASAIRSLRKFKLPDLTEGWLANALTLLRDLPLFPVLRKLSRISGSQYAERFTDPLIRSFLGGGEMGQLSAIALAFSLAWMSVGNAGYSIGGSQAIIRLIEKKLAALGGRIRYKAKVERILVKNDVAVGVQLVGGETIMADWVISAADGHATIYDLLAGKYTDTITKNIYEKMRVFPSYLQVSLGIARDLSAYPPMLTFLLGSPLQVDPDTTLNQIGFRIFNFDPTFAPVGKTAVTSFIPTRNVEYWTNLDNRDLAAYRAEKHRVAEDVIAILEKKIPDLRPSIEVVDVSTPATIIRYTGNWKGSMEGWLLTPGTGFRPLRNTLPGLRNFIMVGQWVAPGGGLPSGLMTARPAIQSICKHDGVPFTPHAEVPARELQTV